MIENRDVLSLFASQYGVATSSQLLDLGVPRRSITRAGEHGSVSRMLPGLYRIAGQGMTFETRAMAALLHCGPKSFLDGVTAAALFGLRRMPKGRTFAAVSGRVTVRVVPPWMAVTSSRHDVARTVTTSQGFRLAQPVWVLLGLASIFTTQRFERAAEDAWHLGLVTPAEAADFLATTRRQGIAGITAFRRWLDHALERPRPSQSGLELDALAAMRLAGLPEPARQHPLVLATGELIHLDFAWPDVRLGIEPGHSWWHGGDLKMAADYDRDLACGEVGWQVERFTEAMRADLRTSGRRIKALYDARRGST